MFAVKGFYDGNAVQLNTAALPTKEKHSVIVTFLHPAQQPGTERIGPNGMVILVDTNVILDSVLERASFVVEADIILTKCRNRELKGYIAGYTVPSIFYILRKRFTVQARRRLLSRLCSFLYVAGLSNEQFLASIDNDHFIDMEDCLRAECAEAVGADYIITRNVSDFAASTIPAILPEDFLAKFGAPKVIGFVELCSAADSIFFICVKRNYGKCIPSSCITNIPATVSGAKTKANFSSTVAARMSMMAASINSGIFSCEITGNCQA